jgi:hypothetical protein
LTVVPAGEIDVRRSRPPAPERLSDEERDPWKRLTFSCRPVWFSGAESLLESYVMTAIYCQRIEAALRKAKQGTGERYQKLARLHWQSAALAATLATRLRLTPSSKLDKRTPTDGELRWPDKEKGPGGGAPRPKEHTDFPTRLGSLVMVRA